MRLTDGLAFCMAWMASSYGRRCRLQKASALAASRDHVHVSDVCKAVVHAITSRANGTFNIASGSAISFHDVARLVRDAIGDDVSIVSVGAESEPTHRHCDAADMRSWFPEFDPTTIESGIGAVVDQYRR